MRTTTRSLITQPRHELTFDGLDLTGAVDYGGFRFEALADEASLGNPEPVDVQVISALLDGVIVNTSSHGNRQPTFQVRITADDGAKLDEAQALLYNSASRRVLFTWKPPDGFGRRRIYKAYTSHLTHSFDDMDELRVQRVFRLTLICDPWAYAEDETTIESVAIPVSPTTTVMMSGSSASGWSSLPATSTQPAVVSSRIKVGAAIDATGTFGVYASDASFSFSSVDFSATTYIYFDVKVFDPSMGLWPLPENYGLGGVPFVKGVVSPYTFNTEHFNKRDLGQCVSAYVDGSKLAFHNYTANSDGSVRFSFECEDTSATVMRIRVGTLQAIQDKFHPAPSLDDSGVLLSNVTRTNVDPTRSSTGRVSSQVVTMPGSARTAASIEISHETLGLGDVLVYTSNVLGAQGYNPSCRPYFDLSNLTTTTDSTLVSGARSVRRTAPTTIAINVPSSRLPEGTYAVVPRYRWDRTDTVTAEPDGFVTTVSHVINNVVYNSAVMPLKPGYPGGTGAGTGTWAMQTVGVVALPNCDIPAGDTATSFVRIALTNVGISTDGAFLVLDDVFLFNLADGSDLTRVNCFTGTPSVGTVHNRLWIQNPTPTEPTPRMYVGTQADQSDAFNPGYPTIKAYGTHPFHPGDNRVYVITTGGTYPSVRVRYTRADF